MADYDPITAANIYDVAQAPLLELLRRCVPYVQRGRFGYPAADELLSLLYEALGEPGAESKS